jgi:hypothetical protein
MSDNRVLTLGLKEERSPVQASVKTGAGDGAASEEDLPPGTQHSIIKRAGLK